MQQSAPQRHKHLVIQTAFVGDLLLSIPMLKHLRKLRPDDTITLLCRKGLGDFMIKAEIVDEVVEVDKESSESRVSVARTLRSQQFSWLICPHQSLRSSWLVRSLHAERKIGYAGPLKKWIFNSTINRPMELPEALRQLALLEPLDPVLGPHLKAFSKLQVASGGQGPHNSLLTVPDWAAMDIPKLMRIRHDFSTGMGLPTISSGAREIAEQHQFRPGKVVFLAPGSVWPTKMWTRDGFIGVGTEYPIRDMQVVLTGAPAESEICAQILREISKKTAGAISIAGRTTLFESAELLALGSLLISNDSGAMHLAAASQVPTVSVFGPTVLELGYRPWQNHAQVVEVARKELPCRPCGKHGAKLCPIGTHACMKNVSVNQVLKAALRVQRGIH